jgi:hypothetical protein
MPMRTPPPPHARAIALTSYGVIPRVLPQLPRSASVVELELLLEEVAVGAVRQGLCPPGKQIVCALQTHQPALASAAGSLGTGTPAAEVPMLRFKVRRWLWLCVWGGRARACAQGRARRRRWWCRCLGGTAFMRTQTGTHTICMRRKHTPTPHTGGAWARAGTDAQGQRQRQRQRRRTAGQVAG